MKKIRGILCLVTALFFVFPPNLLADAVGTLTYIEGRVEKLEPGGREYLPVLVGEGISRGDTIRTKGYSKAEITFEDNSVVRLAETSQIRVKDYNIDEAGFRKDALIGLDRGRLRAIVSKKGRSAFSVETLNAFGTVKGSDIFMGYYNSATNVLVVDGTLEVVNSAFMDQPVAIKEGNAATIPHNSPPGNMRLYIPAEKERYEAETGPAIRKMVELAEGLKAIQAKVVRLSGAVRVIPSGAKSPHTPAVNEILNVGDTIITGEDGQIEIVMDNGHILILKPNTQLILTILTRDPKSGVYENIFECRYGKLIAKLKKLEKGSKFEIKTPTAVCGVRGTIMYLDILPMLTKAFYEGGAGYITSIISGITQIMNPGYSSSADDKGNVFDPTPTTDEEREGFGSLWGDEKSDDDEYGYSKPPDEGGGGDYGEDLGGGAGDAYEPTGGGDEIFDELPPESGGGGTGGEAPTNVATVVSTASGGFGDYYSLANGIPEPQPDNSVNAVITHTTYTDNPTGPSNTVATLNGTYSNLEDNRLWRAGLEGVADDGGRAYGSIGGSWHSWDGVFSSIYIDPSGTAGQLFGLLSGTNDESAGTFGGGGTVSIIPMSETDLSPSELFSSLITEDDVLEIGCVIGDNAGTLTGQLPNTSMQIEGEDWGIWAGVFKGPYNIANRTPEWTGVMGAVEDIGVLGEKSYSFGTFEGIDDLNSSLRIDVMGVSIDNYSLGSFFGTMLGVYEWSAPYNYEAVGAGGWNDVPLTFNGTWGGNTGDTIYYNNYGYFGVAGSDAGYIGSPTPNWYNQQQLEEDEFPFVAIGTYDVGSRQGPYMWNTEFYSYNPNSGLYLTNDGSGTIFAYTTGLMNNNIMDGHIYGISYIPGYGAGIFDDDRLIGSYYPVFGEGSGMWQITGEIDAHYPRTTQSGLGSYDPADLTSFLDRGSLGAQAGGTFGGVMDYLNMPAEPGPGDPYITGISDPTSQTAFLHDRLNARSENWGIFNLKMTGPDSYYNPNNEKTWFVGINGDGDFGYSGYGNTASFVGGAGGISIGDKLKGYIGGIYIDDNGRAGFFEGDLYGLSTEDMHQQNYGTWITSSIGRFQEMGHVPYSRAELEYNINQDTFLGTGTGDFYTDNPYDAGGVPTGGTLEDASFQGMHMNITDEPWGLWAADFKGGYVGPTGPAWYVGISAIDDGNNAVTLLGVGGEEWSDGRLYGDVWGYGFRKDDYNENVLWGQQVWGDAIGTYNPDDSTFDAIAMGEWREDAELEVALLGFNFQDLNNFITVPITEAYWGDIAGTGSFGAGGTITGEMGISFFSDLATPGDGIWAGDIYGQYTLPTSDNFNLILQGDDGISATLNGWQWSDYEWKANVTNGIGPDDIVFNGEAAGRYWDVNPDTGTGHFNGMGAGRYETNE